MINKIISNPNYFLPQWKWEKNLQKIWKDLKIIQGTAQIHVGLKILCIKVIISKI